MHLLSLANDPQHHDTVGAQLQGDADGGWMISFVDILMLLLTLFVLLLAFHAVQPSPEQAPASEPVQAQPLPLAATADEAPAASPANAAARAEAVREATLRATETFLTNAMGTQALVHALRPAAPALIKPSAPEPAVVLLTEAVTRGGLLDALEARTAASVEPPQSTMPPAPPSLDIPAAVRERVQVASSADAVNLIIKDEVLFDQASADLKPQAHGILDELVTILKANEYTVSVEGHTDDNPIHTARYPSNWDLSVARATRVTRYLIEHGIARHRLRAVGYADTQPLDPASTAEARARNRRVSLVVHLREPKAQPMAERSAVDGQQHDA